MGEDTDRILSYGSTKIACEPTRRQRIPVSPSILTHSHVARPSGSVKLQVIAQTPGAPSTPLTPKAGGQAFPGFEFTQRLDLRRAPPQSRSGRRGRLRCLHRPRAPSPASARSKTIELRPQLPVPADQLHRFEAPSVAVWQLYCVTATPVTRPSSPGRTPPRRASRGRRSRRES